MDRFLRKVASGALKTVRSQSIKWFAGVENDFYFETRDGKIFCVRQVNRQPGVAPLDLLLAYLYTTTGHIGGAIESVRKGFPNLVQAWNDDVKEWEQA